MAASLMNLLDDLETRLERTQAELHALRDENQRLKQQLAQPRAQEQSEPSPETTPTAELHSKEAVYPEVTEQKVDVQEAAGQTAPEQGEFEHEAPTIAAREVAQPEPETFEPDVADSGVSSQTTDGAATANNLVESPQSAETAKTPSPHALLNQWYERYPNAFFKGHTKPLKIGIHQDLAEREAWPNKLIRRALANYVNLPRYIKAVRVGAERVDLDGQPAGKVDKEAAQHASEKRGDQQERGDKRGQGVKKESDTPKKAQPKPKTVASAPRQKALEQAESEKNEPRKTLSLEDKLLGLQQKFKGR
ncbi:ABC transporter substrate-binding protein [Vreelandella sulfidaeris]|jgi:ProP effector|uniref:ABC transporter substrate-binding protein n=1 Tax=Vreelandella sulfidaeris TaxID=115553 RepID=A0A365TUW7_9GAMM|nr:ProQ/FINO family protein [Halomonas sulfidaeris]RBI69677.1 ABC transporter substrate-binding protein [Halomonas sulfidaeris]